MLSTVMHKIQSVLHQQEMQKNLGWMNTLTEMDDLEVLKETRTQLAKIEFLSANQLKSQIELVLEIDSKTYRHVKKITHKYLTVLKINKELEVDIFNAIYLYQRQLYVAYTQFFDLYQTQNKVIVTDEKINLILCRLLNTTFTMAKWRYFDDQPAPVGTWTNVHKIIKYAENLSIMNTNLFMYHYQRKETSIATLLKQGFMMDTLQKGNFSRVQIQLTEQVLKIWATNPLILNKYKQDKVHFCINLEEDKGPERIRTVEKFVDYRFWRTTRLVDNIEAYLCAIDTHKPLEEFGLEKIAPVVVIVKLFKKLRVEWCVAGYERQRRKEARNKNSKLLNVTYGIDDICNRLEAIKAKQKQIAQNTNTQSDEADDRAYKFEMNVAMQRRNKFSPQIHKNTVGSENWWMVDESTTGFAVDLGKTYNSWIEVGKLIGYTSPDNKELFVIAEIKSIRKQANGNYRAGLELVGAQANSVKVARVDQNKHAEVSSGYFVDDDEVNFNQLNSFQALLLNASKNNPSQKTTLILPRNEYKRGCEYRIHIEDDDKLVTMGVPYMKQREWVRVEMPF